MDGLATMKGSASRLAGRMGALFRGEGRNSRAAKDSTGTRAEAAAAGVPYLPLDTASLTARRARLCGDPVRIVFFCLGTGYLLPWNAFITAVDYFGWLYPEAHVDRVFTVAYLVPALASLALLVARGHLLGARARVNGGLALLFSSILAAPVMDAAVIRGGRGSSATFAVTVAALAMAGVGDSLVQGTIIGSAGLLPGRYMQAIMEGTGFSAVFVCALRISTKFAFSDATVGALRTSANVYFAVSAVFLLACIVAYNGVYAQTVGLPREREDGERGGADAKEDGERGGADAKEGGERRTPWDVVVQIRWLAVGLALTYVVTLAIFPGFLAEDVSSAVLGDWYAVLLITCYNVFDLVGKSLPARWAATGQVSCCAWAAARMLLLLLFSACVHGPRVFRTEMPVFVLTGLLGLTNGFLTICFFLLAPEAIRGAGVAAAHTAGVVMVMALVVGLTIGSFLGWVWVF